MRPATKDQERAELEALLNQFLNNGGEIRQVQSSRIVPIAWPGNNAHSKLLKTVQQLADIMQMDTSKVEAALASQAAPQCYIHEGEHKWVYTDVERYMRKRKALHYTRKADSYKESAV